MTPEDVVNKELAAYNKCDIEAFVAMHSPDIVIVDGEGNELIRGHARLREVYGAMFRDNRHQFVVITSRIAAGEYVIDREDVVGRADNIRRHAVVINRVKNGLIAHVTLIRA